MIINYFSGPSPDSLEKNIWPVDFEFSGKHA